VLPGRGRAGGGGQAANVGVLSGILTSKSGRGLTLEPHTRDYTKFTSQWHTRTLGKPHTKPSHRWTS